MFFKLCHFFLITKTETKTIEKKKLKNKFTQINVRFKWEVSFFLLLFYSFTDEMK